MNHQQDHTHSLMRHIRCSHTHTHSISEGTENTTRSSFESGFGPNNDLDEI